MVGYSTKSLAYFKKYIYRARDVGERTFVFDHWVDRGALGTITTCTDHRAWVSFFPAFSRLFREKFVWNPSQIGSSEESACTFIGHDCTRSLILLVERMQRNCFFTVRSVMVRFSWVSRRFSCVVGGFVCVQIERFVYIPYPCFSCKCVLSILSVFTLESLQVIAFLVSRVQDRSHDQKPY